MRFLAENSDLLPAAIGYDFDVGELSSTQLTFVFSSPSVAYQNQGPLRIEILTRFLAIFSEKVGWNPNLAREAECGMIKWLASRGKGDEMTNEQ